MCIGILVKSGLKYLIGLVVEASESAAFFLRVFRRHVAVFLQESETISFKQFFLMFLFRFHQRLHLRVV